MEQKVLSRSAETLEPPPSVRAVPTNTTDLSLAANKPGTNRVIRRNGKITAFDASKISVALTKAFLAVEGGRAAASRRIYETAGELSQQVVQALLRRHGENTTFHIEDIQDQV